MITMSVFTAPQDQVCLCFVCGCVSSNEDTGFILDEFKIPEMMQSGL